MMGQLRPAFSELNISEGFEFDTEMVTNEVNNFRLKFYLTLLNPYANRISCKKGRLISALEFAVIAVFLVYYDI